MEILDSVLMADNFMQTMFEAEILQILYDS